MAETRERKEKRSLVDREMMTIAENLEKVSAALGEVEDLKTEMKAIKLYLSRLDPDFKKDFPAILEKVSQKGRKK